MELEAMIAEVLVEHTSIICQRVEANWGRMVRIEGKADIKVDLQEVISSMVTATIEATGMKAWIAEEGSGSLMDMNSPYLAAYLSSDDFNQWRLHSSRMPIMGRTAGSYTDLDGVEHISSGKMEGLDLERDSKAEFQPMLPQHTIQYEVTQEIPDIIAHIQEVVRSFIISQLTMDIQIYL